jgi:hypothetical protein
MCKQIASAIVIFVLLGFTGCQKFGESVDSAVKVDLPERSPGAYLFDHYLNNLKSELISKSDVVSSKVLPCSFCTFLTTGEFLSNQEGSLTFWNSDGSQRWEKRIAVHHDLFLDEGLKEIFLVVGDISPGPEGKRKRIDEIHGYNFAGKQIFYWSFLENKSSLEKIYGDEINLRSAENYWEYSHFNSVQSIPDNHLAKRSSVFQAGNILVNDYWNNIVFIIDRKSKRIVWSLGGESDRKFWHSVRLLPGGEIVAFQNKILPTHEAGAATVKESSVVFLNPVTKAVVHKISKIGGKEFFSDLWGSLQVLSENRFVVTISEQGEAFEIDRSGKVYWHWQNRRSKDPKDHAVYRVSLIPQEVIDSNSLWIKTYLKE